MAAPPQGGWYHMPPRMPSNHFPSSPSSALAHSIARERISENARRVLHRLTEAGFQAYLVGGCVRDLLLGLTPKDFDVATSARPEEVRGLFPRSRLIGRRFRLAHVRSGRDVIEVATFRAGGGTGTVGPRGRILDDNVYGTREEDALRRDFTVNALYFDDPEGSVLDFAGGLEDLEAGLIRSIGDPALRYREDPVRILRAVRFAAKLGFRIERASQAPIAKLAHLIEDVPAARLFEEALKLFQGGHGLESFRRLERFGLFERLYPQTAESLQRDERHRALLERALANTDRRIAEDKPVTPGFLIAALMWGPACERAAALGKGGQARGRAAALEAGGDEALAAQTRRTSAPRRFTGMAREIWAMQPALENRRPRRVKALLRHPRFRAAYDFLCLRAEAGEPLEERAKWWTEVQEGEGPSGADAEPPPPERPPARRRRRSRRRRAA